MADVHITPRELLGYEPTEFQAAFHRARQTHDFVTYLMHRRGGKTESSLAELITGCLTCPRPAPSFRYGATTLKQAKEIAWSPLMKMLSRLKRQGLRDIDVSRTDARVAFRVRSGEPAVLQFFGLEEPETLRGGYDDGMVVDEANSLKPEVWGDVLVARLTDRDGWGVLTGTVKGMDQLYEFYALGNPESDRYDRHWHSLYFPISVTRGKVPWLTDERLDKLAAGMGGYDSVSWRQEMELDWLANDGNLLIKLADVSDAMRRGLRPDDCRDQPHVAGIDPSGHGTNDTVIVHRRGRQVYGPLAFREATGRFLAGQIGLIHRAEPLDAVFVDGTGGFGASVVEALREQFGDLFDVFEVCSSEKPHDQHYFNRRAEMWDAMNRFIPSAALPADERLRKELTSVRYEYVRNRLKLEDKKQVKLRLGHSPDMADALALTFAHRVAPRFGKYAADGGSRRRVVRDEFVFGI